MRWFVFGILLLTASGTAVAQQQVPPGLPTPRIQHVFPPGAAAGPAPVIRHLGIEITLDTELTVTGTDLEAPETLFFSHPGIKARFIDSGSPPPGPKAKEKKDGPRAGSGPHRFRVSVDANVPAGKKAAWLALTGAITGAARQTARDKVKPPTAGPA